MGSEKIISFAIPCYNSAEYMDHCIQSILDGSRNHLDNIEILIVDDGSAKDSTPQKADEWEAAYPGVIRAFHQKNAGHGGAVNKGIANATGTYFKVVDSDDWLDEASLDVLIEMLLVFEQSNDDPIDLFLCNYVYENVELGQDVVDYKKVLPVGKPFTWSEIGKFPITEYVTMHSTVYRTSVLRECNLQLPEHTFYVDNIFVYVPLPFTKRCMYVDLDLYRYFVGREDQSVNEKVMAGRIDQQLRVTRVMIDAYDLTRDIPEPKLAKYMSNYLAMMMTICTIFSILSERDDQRELRDEIWGYLKKRNPRTYETMKHNPLILLADHNSLVWDKIGISVYRLMRMIFKFN